MSVVSPFLAAFISSTFECLTVELILSLYDIIDFPRWQNLEELVMVTALYLLHLNVNLIHFLNTALTFSLVCWLYPLVVPHLVMQGALLSHHLVINRKER